MEENVDIYEDMEVAYPSGDVIIIKVPAGHKESLMRFGQLPLRPIN